MVSDRPSWKLSSNHLLASLRIRQAYYSDVLFGYNRDVLSNARHMRLAAEWLANAQDATTDGGISAVYSLRSGWDVSYPETTGYIIPTLINYALATKETAWLDRAIRMADWLTKIQLNDGAFPDKSDLFTPRVFDTGQIIFGLVGIFRETRENRFLLSAIKGARWLISQQEPTGAWIRYSYKEISHSYYTRVAWALLILYQEVGETVFLEGARKNLDWAATQQLDNGWFKNNAFTVDENPLLHTIAYTAQGLLEAGLILEDDRYIQSTIRVADALIGRQRADGALPGVFDRDWQPVVQWSCLTGNSQMAIVWLRLYRLRRKQEYLDAARKANCYMKRVQGRSVRDPGVRGGIKGSHPIDGAYVSYAYPNWAVKFFLDALMQEELVIADSSADPPFSPGNLAAAG